MNNYGYQQYKEQSVTTMTSGEMLILLYDETLKRLARAEFALKQSNFELFDASIVRAQEIIQYLMDTLDWKYPISGELQRLYQFFLYELTRIQAGRNVTVIEELKPLIADLRDTFKEADRINSKK